MLAGDDAPVYLDSACMTLKPRQVTAAVAHYMDELGACAGRSVHRLAGEVAEATTEARAKVAALAGVAPERLVWQPNTTTAINLVASGTAWAKDGSDVVMTTDREHNSNLVPWLRLHTTGRARHAVLPTGDRGEVDLDHWHALLEEHKPRLVALGQASNVDGTSIPAREAVRLAQDLGARVLLDAAQAMPHQEVRVDDLGADYTCWSLHKMLGPSGVGALAGGSLEALEELEPLTVGGHTVDRSNLGGYDLSRVPDRFEGGLQDYGGQIGAGAACDYLTAVGRDEVAAHERKLNARLHEGLLAAGVPEEAILGPLDPAARGGLTAFNLPGLTPHEVALYLDEVAGIAVRSGHHCNHATFAKLGQDGAVRSSLYLYNTEQDVDALVAAVEELAAAL